jgi:hypothetical protein
VRRQPRIGKAHREELNEQARQRKIAAVLERRRKIKEGTYVEDHSLDVLSFPDPEDPYRLD